MRHDHRQVFGHGDRTVRAAQHHLRDRASDSADLPVLTKAINVARPGYLKVTMADGSTGTLFLAAGTLAEMRVRRVWATGTSAGGISGLS